MAPTLPKTTENERGFAFLLLAILVFVAAAIGLTVLADTAMKDDQRSTETTRLVDVYRAIVGDVSEDQFGYLGDVGDYPAKLENLMRAPAGATGWNGPYLSDALFSDTTLYDSYGSPLEYFLNLVNGSTDEIAIISKGADHSSSNTAGSANDWSQFVVPSPSAAAYYTTNYNADNVVYPDSRTSLAAVDYENVGNLNYLITNFDNNATINAVVPVCPLLYNVAATSDTRGTTDTITIPYAPASPASSDPAQIMGFVQGFWRMAITSSVMKDPLFQETVANYPGRTRTRRFRGPTTDSSVTPMFQLTVKNSTAVQIDIFQFTTLVRNNLNPGTTAVIGTYNTCTNFIAKNNGGTTLDTWVLPYGINSTRTVGSNYNTLTITNTGGGGAAAQRELIVYEDGIPLGTVYRRKTVTFSRVPNGAPIVVTNQVGTTVGTLTMGTGATSATF